MLKRTISYTDYNDEKREEDYFFNLSKAELAEMELMTAGGFSGKIDRIVNAKDVPEITETFKDIILRSYGEKSPDGKRFIKSKELSEAFYQTEAYSELFMELVTNADKAAEFINGILPVLDKPSIPAPASK